MPSTRTEYSILLSSPSDVPNERAAAEEIVAEISDTWRRTAGVILRLLSWENDAAPSFGAEPQDVVNNALGASWDIYLGLMHARFGTPTKKFGSGTEEEFSRAYEVWKTDKENRLLMFYFKKSPLEMDTLDVDQFTKVKTFKSKLPSLGGLYRDFTDTEDFKTLFRAHLTTNLSELHRRHSSKSSFPPRTDAPAIIEQPVNVELGVLDYMETALSNTGKMAAAMNRITVLMTTHTTGIQQGQQELEKASALGDVAGMRHGTNIISKSMTDLAKELGDVRRDYSGSSRTALEAFSRAISSAKASGATFTDAESLLATIEGTHKQLEEYIKVVLGLERSMNTVPNIAKSFSSARLLLQRELSAFRSELKSTLGLFNDFQDILKES